MREPRPGDRGVIISGTSVPVRVTITSTEGGVTAVQLDDPATWIGADPEEVTVDGVPLRAGVVLLLEPGA